MNKSFKTLWPIYLALIFLAVTAEASPWIISHRGGGQNFPENTLLAFSKSLEMGCQALELDVQVSQDGVVVVYHPDDLKQWTNGFGPVSSQNWKEIATLNAAYYYKPQEGYPYREQNLSIPTLEEVLNQFPKTLLIVDMKSLPAEPLVKALVDTISDEESMRLIFYSTNSEHIELLHQYKPHWRTFEKRDFTRQRLLDLNQTGGSDLPVTSSWIGFELKRKMSVTETFALGKGTSTVEFHLWTPQVIAHLRNADPNSFLVLFGINKKDEWKSAVYLGVNAVFTDNPYELLKLKNEVDGVNHKVLK